MYFKQMTLATNRPLYEEEWFHGVLPREEVVRLLKSEGDFLVRETIRNEESQIVLSVCWNGHKHFIVQTTADGLYRFEGPAFPSIQELIMHQNLSELPVTSRSGAILKKPVLRERWELSNDDVILLDKIGRVRYWAMSSGGVAGWLNVRNRNDILFLSFLFRVTSEMCTNLD